MAVFRKSLSVLRIYYVRNINYVFAVNIGTQSLYITHMRNKGLKHTHNLTNLFLLLLFLVLLQLPRVFPFLGQNVLQYRLFVKQITVLPASTGCGSWSTEWHYYRHKNTHHIRSLRYIRYHRIPAGLQSQAAAVEIFDGVLAHSLNVGAITWRRRVLLLLVIRVYCTSGTIPRVSRHRNHKCTICSSSLEKILFVSLQLLRWRLTTSAEVSNQHAVGHLDAPMNRAMRMRFGLDATNGISVEFSLVTLPPNRLAWYLLCFQTSRNLPSVSFRFCGTRWNIMLKKHFWDMPHPARTRVFLVLRHLWID